MIRYFTWPGAFGKGPRRSILHLSNGQGATIADSSVVGTFAWQEQRNMILHAGCMRFENIWRRFDPVSVKLREQPSMLRTQHSISAKLRVQPAMLRTQLSILQKSWLFITKLQRKESSPNSTDKSFCQIGSTQSPGITNTTTNIIDSSNASTTYEKTYLIDLTKNSDSEGGSKEENPERKLANTLRGMIGLGKLGSSNSKLGFPSSTSSSSEEDDVLRDDPRFWDYDDLDDWEAVEPSDSSEASYTGHLPPIL
ncbi:hypothetical protein PIB30_036212 [Stylosanthes scabra]|uniref:Uncharacterized protein n=1 Tax=Stylosanthes scabra TaxID=79078 RepID=A0ABU6TDL2_9FABA|nr:hypothetical protein [Stylosanthes scabra]